MTLLIVHLLGSGTGEVFGGLSVPAGECDSKVLLDALSAPGAEVTEVLSTVEGPFALVYWQQQSQRLWVARDALGWTFMLVHPTIVLDCQSPL